MGDTAVMVLVMVLVTEDFIGDTTLERDLLMLNPKANHGCPMDTVVMVFMVLDTEDFMEDIMDTTLESDLLMLSQKASHGWDTDTVDTLDTAAMVSVMADFGENKPPKSY